MGESKFYQIRNFIIGVFFTIVGLYPFYFLFTREKHVHSYYLDSWSDNAVNKFPAIHVDIENSFDDRILLPNTVSFETAVHMVDSLNSNLVKLKTNGEAK